MPLVPEEPPVQWRIRGGGVRGFTPPPEVFFFFFCLSVYENPADLGPVSKWSLRQDLLLKLRHVNDSSSRFLSLSSKSCLKLHLETGPWTLTPPPPPPPRRIPRSAPAVRLCEDARQGLNSMLLFSSSSFACTSLTACFDVELANTYSHSYCFQCAVCQLVPDIHVLVLVVIVTDVDDVDRFTFPELRLRF